MKINILLGVSLYSVMLYCQPKVSSSTKEEFNVNADTTYTYITPTRDGIGKVYMGREIAQVMGAAGAAWLERQERDKEEGTTKALARLPLNSNSSVADIGAGTGYYTFRIARKVPDGKVYAVDVQDELVEYLHEEVKKQHAGNVVVVKGKEDSPNLPDTSVDMALMVDVYHELAYPSEMLQAIHAALKPGGKLVLLEYRGEDLSIPIKALHKMTVAQTDKELQANGYRRTYKGDFLPIQHFLVYEKVPLP